MKKILFIIVCLLISTPVLAEDSADDSTGRDDTKVYHVYDDVELVSTHKIQYDKPRIVVKSVYPQLQSDTIKDSVETFNQLVIDLAQDKISEFKAQVIANQEAQQNLPAYQRRNDLYLDYDSSFIQSGKNPIISIRFSDQGYIAGMAHPYHHHFVLNYDLNNNEKINLDDLFSPDADYLPVLSSYTSSVLNRRLRDKQMIADGTAPKPENFKNWNIKPNGLLFTFDEYQVAPYVNGAQTVLVPYSILKKMIDPDSLIANCVTNKKRCSRSNVLTGGFIDEAINLRAINPHHRLFSPTLSKL